MRIDSSSIHASLSPSLRGALDVHLETPSSVATPTHEFHVALRSHDLRNTPGTHLGTPQVVLCIRPVLDP